MCDVSLIIVTRDRREALQRTLQGLESWHPPAGEVLVYDDSPCPGTLVDVPGDRPNVRWFRGPTPIGLSRGRNVLLRHARGSFVICLDDDADVLTPDAGAIIRRHFEAHPRCGIVTFRVWWSAGVPLPAVTRPVAAPAYECNDFLGGAHAMRADCFATGGQFAEWMNIYGEEGYVAMGAARQGWEVHYLPEVLVHHRAEPVEQRQNPARVRWWLRQQLFNQLGIVASRVPGRFIPLRVTQLLAHYVWRYGVRQRLIAECAAAVAAFVRALPEILRVPGRLTPAQYRRWRTLPAPVYYWSPDDGD